MVHKARNGNFSLPGPRVVSPKVIYLYRKCKEFDLNCVSNRALTVACKHPGVVSPLGGKCASLSFFLCPLTRSVLCRNSEVFELSFSSFLVWVFASFLSLVFNRNFVTKSVLPRTTNILFICGSVLLQLVCCFGLIFYPPRSPQEVWRVWWVASCFWVRERGACNGLNFSGFTFCSYAFGR